MGWISRNLLPPLRAAALSWWLCLALFTPVCEGFEGCQVRYGRRGCIYQVLKGVLVTCNGQDTETHVPHNIPQDAVYMSLTNFNFDRLEKEDFEPFKTVQCLTVSNSVVKSVAHDTFSGMEKLQELVLENTKLKNPHLQFVGHPTFRNTLLTVTGSEGITSIDLNATTTLHHLKSLILQDNGLENVNARIFPELRQLQKLDLSQNRLKYFPWEALKVLEQLNILYMDGNDFQTVPQSVHSVFFSVKELTLAGNPFHCNCKLKWLKEFFIHAVDKDMDDDIIRCASPVEGAMRDFNPEDFTCARPAEPRVIYQALSREHYVLNCTSTGDPAPNITLVLPDGRTIITPPSQDLSQLATVTPDILTTPGEITCYAANTEGTSTFVARLPRIEAFSAANRRNGYDVITLLITSLLLAVRL